MLQDAAAHQVNRRRHVAAHAEICEQQHQAQHGTRDEGQGELRHQFAEGLEDEELDEALNHGASVGVCVCVGE